MKTFKLITLLLIFAVSATKVFTQSHNPYGFQCSEVTGPPLTQPLIGGQFKPESIDKYTSVSTAVFPVLVVFVQFKNDQGLDAPWWHSGEAPDFLGTTIATRKNTNYGSSWWDAYSQENATLSDFWMEVSRGDFHVTGQAVSVVLTHEYTYYQSSNGGHGIGQINDDIYAALQQNPNIDWPFYDKWKYDGTFIYQPDNYVDMMYIVYRSFNPDVGMPAGGIACLFPSYSQGENYLIYNQGGQQIYIKGLNIALSSEGSGLIMSPGYGGDFGQPNFVRYQPMTKLGTISFSEHEHGHYLFGSGHMKYGKMMGAGADYGLDEFLSPYESLLMGYMTSKPAHFDEPLHTLDDYSSRNSSAEGEVLEVPINGSNEFFLIANRMKVSYYDKIMWGDTAHDNPYSNYYGKSRLRKRLYTFITQIQVVPVIPMG